MADHRNPPKDENDTKRQKTQHDFHEEEDRRYWLMLDKVGQCLTKQDVRRLARTAGLSTNEISGILQGDEGHPEKLMEALDRRQLVSRTNLKWLEDNLREIEHEEALAAMNKFSTSISGGLCVLPSEPESDSSDEAGDASSCTFHDFLKDIGLEEKFPRKLTLNSFLEVKDKVDPKQSVELFWQKLTSLDYRAGYPQHYVSKSFSMRDFVFAVLQCADDFLRQDILEKMAACQLAVPIILQGVDGNKPQYLLWALRRIMKKWKGNSDSHALEQPIATYPVFTVSVLRIGDVRVSKSNLLNTMLGYSQGNSLHSFLLSMEKDIVKPHFSLGSIDCVWFLPQHGNDKEIFQEVTAFLNLRGDCSKYVPQTEFACKAANLTIALVATSKRDKHHHVINLIEKSSSKTLFVAIKDEDKQFKRPQKVHNPRFKDGWLFVKVLQVDVLSRHICTHITSTFQTCPKQYKSLESLAKLCSHDLLIDEERQMCKDAKVLVSGIFESVSSENIIEFKKNSFPLQECWADLVRFEKDPSLSDAEEEGSVEHQRKMMQTKRAKAREEQIHSSLSKSIQSYHNFLTSYKSNSSMLKYIFGYLQDEIYHLVNINTRKDNDNILELENQIDSYRKRASSNLVTERSNVKMNDGKTQSITEINYHSQQCALKALLKQQKSKNLGCEHFLRELGQLFEAFTETNEQERYGLSKADMTLLPALAARLVTEMHSLELMDGDTGNVPLIWITNVLDTLTRTLGDPKILVLSAIGVQSSGKSTLLNSMFGLKFPVRAGRCTRGLFIRLLKLEKSLAEDLGLNYFVIVDTEGIQSVEQDSRRFDNELVTLALSIANITIFNIEGENIGPDMTGILQIAAHALMRMKEVDIECQCRIVQQRVSDLTAADRNKANNDIIMETLDEATKIAADEEGLSGRYQKFDDVVNLHVDEGLQYIPCLWTGGMAPPNHMYSEIVTKIKAKLIQDIRDGIVIPDMTLSTFTERVRDVWEAVEKEDFVFNFQDSVKAVDFNKLCLNCNEWVLHMRHQMMVATETCYAMMDGKFVELELVQRADSDEDIITGGIDHTTTVLHIDEIKCFLRNEAGKQEDHLIGSIEDYIDKHPRKNSLIKYKEGFISDLRLDVRDVENDALETIQDEYELSKIQHDLPNFRNECRIKLALKAKSLASSVSDNVKDSSIAFERKWEEWIFAITNSRKHLKSNITLESLQVICEKLLLRVTRGMAVGSEIKHLMTGEGGIDKHTNLRDCGAYIHDKFVRAWLMQATDNYDRMNADTNLIEKERKQALVYVTEVIEKTLQRMFKENRGKSLDTNLFQLMLQRALKELSERPKFKLPYAMIAKGLLYLSCKAFRHLFVSTSLYQNDCAFLLQDEKNAIFKDFLAFQKNNKEIFAVRAAEFIYYYVQPIYKRKSLKTRKTCNLGLSQSDFIDDIKVHLPWDVLRSRELCNDLIYTNVFLMQSYISCEILSELISRLKWGKLQNKVRDMLCVNLNDLVNRLIEIIDDTDSSTPTTFDNWLSTLSNKVGCPTLRELSSLYVIEDFIEVSGHLREIINDRLLKSLSQNIEVSVFSHMSRYMNTVTVCHHTCPLCGVPCDNLLTKHTEHYSFLHRPRGYIGEACSETNELITEDCFASVGSKTTTFVYNGERLPCHQYQRVYPNWRITPTSTNYGITFWQWSMVRDNEVLASNFQCRKADIPSSWYNLDEESAMESLDLDQEAKLNGRHSAAASKSSSR